ncbi:uncharacterized protein N7459_001497 [Penicillium hispanicum]|uniref:uncharacterized protein n=1 Tax=Penicillium hispanicum TaxID=1080232 RepID=UPI0025418DEF|nr:uncharacterized protein N7459_001497 [Penicillium hispanicum]KAJ5595289.1 hypothetical protein N7459_001497 [Penicillium hispanicum]
MGNNISIPSKEGNYQMVLGPDSTIQILAGSESINTECVDQNLHLEVRNWRSAERSFHLDRETVAEDGKFSDKLNWLNDTVHFFFRLPGIYEGGQPEFLRRTRQLFEETGPLGISSKYTGKDAVESALVTITEAKITRRDWYRPGKNFNGCRCTWLKRSISGSKLVFKFAVDSDEKAILVVDENDEAFQNVCLSGQGSSFSPSKFFEMMVLPVRIWLRINYWTALYEEKKAEHQKEMDIMMSSGKEATVHDENPPDAETLAPWWQSLVSVVDQAQGRKEAEQKQKKAEAKRLRASYVAAMKKKCHSGSEQVEQENPRKKSGDNTISEAALDSNSVSSAIAGDTEPSESSMAEDNQKRIMRLQRKRHKRKMQVRRRREQKRLQADMKGNKQPGPASKSSDVSGRPEDITTFTPHSVKLDVRSSSAPSLFTTLPPLIDNNGEHQFRRASYPSSLNFQTPPQSPFPRSERASSPIQGVHEEIHKPEHPATPGEEMSTAGVTPTSVEHDELRLPGTQNMPGEETPTDAFKDPETAFQYSPAEESTVLPEEILTRRGRITRSCPERTSSASSESLDNMSSGVAENTQSDSAFPEATTGRPILGKALRRRLKKVRQRKKWQLQKQLAKGNEPEPEQGTPGVNEDTPQLDASQKEVVTDAHSMPSQNQPTPTTPTPSAAVPSSNTSKKKAKAKNRKKKSKGKRRASATTAPTAESVSSDDSDASTSVAENQSTNADSETSKAVPCMPESAKARFPASQPGVSAAHRQYLEDIALVIHGKKPTPSQATSAAPGSSNVGPAGRTQGGSAATPPAASSQRGRRSSQASQAHAASSALPSRDHQSSATATAATQSSQVALGTAQSQATSPPPERYKPLQQPKQGFFWDLTYHGFQCAKDGCEKQCATWDNQSCICPGCGPFSRVRYCGKEHMREDITAHWLYCGQFTFEHYCVKSSVPADIAVGPPLIPCVHNWDSPERHRQAVWFSTARNEGDYFLFADWDDQVSLGVSPGSMVGRCSPRVRLTVRFDDPEQKDRFRRCLAICLLASVEVQKLVEYVFRMIRDYLREKGKWANVVDAMLRLQFRLEFGVALRPTSSGQRHACITEWTGQARRHCRDPTCSAESQSLLGDAAWGRGYRHMCHYVETNRWLLRAHRTTHPTVNSVAARTCGEGWDGDVVEEERRAFRRGEGWDGAGSGPLEMEGPL